MQKTRILFLSQKNFLFAKSKWSAVQFQYISIALNLAYNKSTLYKTFIDPKIC